MPIREDEYLPSKEELTVPEINVTSGVFRAASPYMGKYCDDVCKEFMLCRDESRGDMRQCINEGKEVTRCGMQFFQQEFMLCRDESRGDARRCINEGKEVTRCGMQFFQQVKKNCYESFTEYWNCIDKAEKMSFKHCRASQKLFDDCIGPALNIERPPPGYFSKVRILDINRAKPRFNDPELPPVMPEFKP